MHEPPTLFHLPADPSSSAPLTPDAALSSARSDPSVDYTDLLGPLRGTGGNHDNEAEQVMQLLRHAGIGLETIVDLLTNVVPAPPLKATDPKEVRRWLGWAADRIPDYDAAMEVRRGVLRILEVQAQLEYHALRHAERLDRLRSDQEAKAAGTYWRDRDARRTATRPVHIEVDPDVWAELKRESIRRRSSLGVTVGSLVNAEVTSGGQTVGRTNGETSPVWSDRLTELPTGRRARVFARIAVDDETWASFRALVEGTGLTIARALGVLVEHAVAGVE